MIRRSRDLRSGESGVLLPRLMEVEHADQGDAPNWNYPEELPVVEHRAEIVAAVRAHPVVVVVSDTGSGKTTQLPKMVVEALGPGRGRIGCTQPRRIAAASVSKRVAEEVGVPLGGYVGYQVRFDERLGPETRIKFMTDGILLAETQGDRDLRQYDALVIDEAHERSLNIDFLLGYLSEMRARRPEFRLVISSATLDAGAFAAFFRDEDGNDAPVIEAPGRMFPVREEYLPGMADEDLPQHVARAVGRLDEIEPGGDVLVFLPGEREIRECADVLEGWRFPNTEVLPLFARLGLGDQQKVFNPGRRRRLVLATNVAETSLTIPRITCVIDSGIARVSRWNPAKGIQRLQLEDVSQASARQRKGRCGRVREGVCLRLYDEESLEERPEFTDPEIRRSSLAGVILRMKLLGLPEISDFPFLDPPAPKAVTEGYRTLREIGALDDDRNLTRTGHRMARLPVDPRLARMLIEAEERHCLSDVLAIVAALSSNDPRERPAEKAREADAAHARWKDEDSDFMSILRLWRELQQFRQGKRGRQWQQNKLRRFAGGAFLNARRIVEWGNVHEELEDCFSERGRGRRPGGRAQPPATPEPRTAPATEISPDYVNIHRSLLAGAPRQFGLWDKENRAYRSASGGFFAIFPGSGLFGRKQKWEWVLAMELVETTRLWARRVARIDPAWVEEVAPHLCRSKFGEAHWDPGQGAVYGKETVICGGLDVVRGRRVHYGRVDPKVAHQVFIREGILGGGLRNRPEFLNSLDAVREEIELLEEKTRRPNGLWDEGVVMDFFDARIPSSIHSAAEFQRWLNTHHEGLEIRVGDVLGPQLDFIDTAGFPDILHHAGEEYPVYYHAAPGQRDDGVTIGVHVDQLPGFPEWLPGWGVDAHLRERTELILRALPKEFRRICQPMGELAEHFAERWRFAPKDATLANRLAEFISEMRGNSIPVREIDISRVPPELVTKIWVCDDDGNELAMGEDVPMLKLELSDLLRKRFEAVATASIERRGMSRWDGENLPEIVQTPGGPTFPALVDEGKSVGVNAFLSLPEAMQAHRGGIARLMLLAQPEQAAHLRKKFPLGMLTKVELPRLGCGGTALEDLVMLAAESILPIPPPRSPEGFHAAADQARGDWHARGREIGTALDPTVEALGRIRSWVDGHLGDRNFGPVAADLDQQLQWLFRTRFAWNAGLTQLRLYPRRLAAIESRLKRLDALPLIKDLEKLERFRPHWDPWFEAWRAKPADPSLWPHGWMLEDLRIATFAPDLNSPTKVSEKRVADAWRAVAAAIRNY